MTALGGKVLQIADSLKYVRELTGHNDHPMIDRILAYMGLPKGLSWCLAFAVFCYGSAAAPVKNPLPRIARCSLFWETCQGNEFRYKTVSAEDVRWGAEQLLPGDVGIFSHHPNRKNWDGHAVLVVRQDSPRTFQTIEGNTVGVASQNAAEQRGEGGTRAQGVFYRTRYTDGKGGLYFEGAVRPRRS